MEFRDLNAAELNLDKKGTIRLGKISADVVLQKSAVGIGADFMVRYDGEFTCVRCLQKFTQHGDANLHLDYIEGSDPHLHSDNVELNAHEADRVYYRGTYIDLSVGIREALLLAQPIVYICRDDCSGLCPVCGVNLNKGRCTCKDTKAGLFAPAAKAFAKKRGRTRRK
ncbi:MAG: DUF177 domain-containing protein [candidate division WOR-3 bacterium]|nr:MAG: DUF177 domain-containing protein [candidate division WOR-3 bacterium]